MIENIIALVLFCIISFLAGCQLTHLYMQNKQEIKIRQLIAMYENRTNSYIYNCLKFVSQRNEKEKGD